MSDQAHRDRLQELADWAKLRPLTAAELWEVASHFRAIGNETEALKAEAAANRAGASRQATPAATPSVSVPAAANVPATRRSQQPPSPSAEFVLGFLIPIVGVIRGLVQVTNKDPDIRHVAGPSFGGAVAGMAVYTWAVIYFLPVLVLGPGGPSYNQGVELFQQEHWTGAAMAFEKAVKTDPNLAIAWSNLAACQLHQENPVAAEASARRAVALVDAGRPRVIPDGETPETITALAHGNLAVALAAQSKLAEAGPHAQRALQLYPTASVAPNWQEIVNAATLLQSYPRQ